MAECNHDFIGTAQHIKCRRCGLVLSAEQYKEYKNPQIKKRLENPVRERRWNNE